jgi:hypothetical protein
MIHPRFMRLWEDAQMRTKALALLLACLGGMVAAAAAAQAGPPPSPDRPRPLVEDARLATYEMGEIVRAADGAFGEASEAVARVIERVFADLGKPNAYIVGREGAGALGLGIRYGKGTLHSRTEGERVVHWTGPSIGLDVGGDASRTFMLVYNLDDSEDIFQRFPALEGRAYLVGGVSASYHQRGRVVLVPIRLGAGWRLGANVGYLLFTRSGRVIPL